jgi:tetratricopeptide (TPR) repeat protein
MRVNPGSGMAPVHYGEFFRESDPEKALRYFELAHRNAPKEGMPLTKVGETQLALGRKEEALASFLEATRVARPVRETWTRLLLLQVDLERYEEAEGTVADAISHFPGDWPLLMNGGNFHLLVRKDAERALPLFLKAHQLDPAHPDSIRACLKCYRVMGDEAAASRFERLLRDP